MTKEIIIDIKKLSFAYAGTQAILNNISFSVCRGQIISIIGPNGVGKTTLLNCMANLLTPNSGEILIEGKNLGQMKTKEIANKIAFVPQFIIPSFAYEVLSYVVTGCAPRVGTFEKPKKEHYELAQHALKQMGIDHLAQKYYTQISGGERQQVSIARALAQKPRVILMDEPTAHLDYGNQIRVLKIIKKLAYEGYAAVITTHNPDHALLLGGEVAAINFNGQFTFGSSSAVISEHFLSFLYGVDLRLHHIPDIGRDVCVAASL